MLINLRDKEKSYAVIPCLAVGNQGISLLALRRLHPVS